MRNKIFIVNMALKLRKKFEGLSPTETYSKLRSFPGIREVYSMWETKEYIVFIFLLTCKLKDETNLKTTFEYLFDMIYNHMFIFNICRIDNVDPLVECDECGGFGSDSCDRCGGDLLLTCRNCEGRGEVVCEYCSGYGEYNSGETCDECQGGGYITCDDCNGDGDVRCNKCEHGNVDCKKCDGNGELVHYGSFGVECKQMVTYDIDFINSLDENKHYNFLYSKISNFGKFDVTSTDNKFYLLIKFGEVSTEMLNDYNIGDVLITYLSKLDNNVLSIVPQNGVINTSLKLDIDL